MADGPAYTIVVVCEAAADQRTACALADRVLVMNEGTVVADAVPADALTPARLAAVFGIEAETVAVDNKQVPIARRAL